MTVIPRRNFKERLQLYVIYLFFFFWGGGGEGKRAWGKEGIKGRGGRGGGGGGEQVLVKRVNKRPGVKVGVGVRPYVGYM